MSIVIIGVGNEYRHDDGVGPSVVERLRYLALPGVTLAGSDGEPTGLIELWDGVDLAIVVDAVRGGGVPGQIYRMGLHHPSTRSRTTSSHRVQLGDAVALALALDRMPRQLLLYGVQVADVSPGVGLSAAVDSAAMELVREIADQVGVASRAGVA